MGMEKKNEFDEKMRQMLREQAQPLPESYEKRVESVLSRLTEDEEPKKRVIRMNWRVAAAIVAVMLLVTAPAAVAGVRTYIAHLNQMEPEHAREIGDAIQNSEGEADVYSRELLPSERERMSELREQYEEGNSFPNQELKQIQTETERQAGEFCFCYENSTYYLPETEMSEEQLRQIVDFQYRRDYVLEKAQEVDKASEEPEEPEEEAVQTDVVGEEKKMFERQAADLLKKLYDLDTNGAKCKVVKEDDEVIIHYTNKAWDYDAEVAMDAKDKTILGVFVGCGEEDEFPEGIPVNETEYRRQGEKVRKIAEMLLPSKKIKEVVMVYNSSKEKMLEFGTVNYYAVCQDNSGYWFTYRADRGQISQFAYSTEMNSWMEDGKELEATLKQAGIKRNRVVLAD